MSGTDWTQVDLNDLSAVARRAIREGRPVWVHYMDDDRVALIIPTSMAQALGKLVETTTQVWAPVLRMLLQQMDLERPRRTGRRGKPTRQETL